MIRLSPDPDRTYNMVDKHIAECRNGKVYMASPVRATVRHVGGATQTGRARAERLTTRFEARPAARTIGANATVVVVDDVRTTGASLVGVAAALRSVGIRKVIGATLGATPRSVPFPRPDPLQSG